MGCIKPKTFIEEAKLSISFLLKFVRGWNGFKSIESTEISLKLIDESELLNLLFSSSLKMADKPLPKTLFLYAFAKLI